MEPLAFTAMIVTVCCATVAAITDLTRSKIYNALTIPMAISGLLVQSMVAGSAGFVNSFLGMVIGFGLVLLPFLMGGMGGGDVKLLAGIGAWVGVPDVFYVFVFAGLMAGLSAIALMAYRKRSLAIILRDIQMMIYQVASVGAQSAEEGWAEQRVTRDHAGRSIIPFGVLLACAVIVSYLWTA